MSSRIVRATETSDRAGCIGFGDVDGYGSSLIVIVAVAGEGPDGRATRNVGEGSAQIECAGALAANTRAGATGTMSSRIVRATETSDRTGRIGFIYRLSTRQRSIAVDKVAGVGIVRLNGMTSC